MSTCVPLVCRKCGHIGDFHVPAKAEAKAPIFWVHRHDCGALAVAAIGIRVSDEALNQIDAEMRISELRERAREASK